MKHHFSFILIISTTLTSLCFGEILYGPETVNPGETVTGTFGMNCNCTAYFLDVVEIGGSGHSKGFRVKLNGTVVLEDSERWSQHSKQVKLKENQDNIIETEVVGQGGAGITVAVYERDVTPEPVPERTYIRHTNELEKHGEYFVLNNWANRFYLDIINGNPDGSNRVTSGIVRIEGQVVVDETELNSSIHTIRKEIEFMEGVSYNRVTVSTWGNPGDFVTIGVTEAAQTVTVEEVWDVEVPGFKSCGIGMLNGEPIVRFSNGFDLMQIDGQGNQELLIDYDGENSERPRCMSPRGSYVWTSARSGDDWIYRLYDPQWNVVHETIGPQRRIQQIAETGNTLLGYDPETAGSVPCVDGRIAVYDRMGNMVSTVMRGFTPQDFDIFNQLSPDGLYCWVYCNDNLQVYGVDGVLQWEAPMKSSRELANNGMAVQSTKDYLFFHDSSGNIERRVFTESPANQCGFARTTPDGKYGAHRGSSYMAAARSGPQSCWKFEPGSEYYVYYHWISDDGNWELVEAVGPTTETSVIWLLGAGGEVMWQSAPGDYCTGTVLRMLTSNGEYFFLPEMRTIGSSRSVWSRLFKVVVE